MLSEPLSTNGGTDPKNCKCIGERRSFKHPTCMCVQQFFYFIFKNMKSYKQCNLLINQNTNSFTDVIVTFVWKRNFWDFNQSNLRGFVDAKVDLILDYIEPIQY